MKGQYEQQCNAEALKKMDVPVLKKMKMSKVGKISDWIKSGKIIPVNFPNQTSAIIDEIFERKSLLAETSVAEPGSVPYSPKKLRNIIISNILHKSVR